jgi:hypothetical protein
MTCPQQHCIAKFQKPQNANESICPACSLIGVAHAFDLLELEGDDLRQRLLAEHKAALAKLLANAKPGIRYKEHIEATAR